MSPNGNNNNLPPARGNKTRLTVVGHSPQEVKEASLVRTSRFGRLSEHALAFV